MGRLDSLRAQLDDQIVLGMLMVRNTFLDVPELADGSAPPKCEPLHRFRTAPTAASADAVAAAAGSDSMDDGCCFSDGAASTAGHAGIGGTSPPWSAASSVSESPSAPSSPSEASFAASALDLQALLAEEAQDALSSDDDASSADADEDATAFWDLRVRRTFLDCGLDHRVEERDDDAGNLRRVASMPDIGRPDVDEVEAQRAQLRIQMSASSAVRLPLLGAASAHSRQSASEQMQEWWPATPRAEEEVDMVQFTDDMVVWMPMERMEPFFANADNDGSWPMEYDEAALAEEENSGGSGGSNAVVARSRKQRRAHGPAVACRGDAAADPLQVLADAHFAAAEGYEGQVWALSCRDGASSFIVQRAIAILGRVLGDATAGQRWRVRFDAEALMGQLQGHVLEALQHPHANHVIKQALELLPTEYIGFIADELIGSGVWAARHKFACRAVLRLVRHCGKGDWASAAADAVLAEVLENAQELCCDEFGKFVLEELLERGLPEQRRQVLAALRIRLARHAKHEHASFLIQRALRCNECLEVGGVEMAEELVAYRETVWALARNQYGRYVLKDLSRSPAHASRVRELVMPLASELQGSKQGKKLLLDLTSSDFSWERRMY